MLDDLMMEAKVTRIGRHGIRFLGADYWHDSFISIRGTVIVRYSFFDISFVKVYTEDGEYLGIAERVQKVHPMAEQLGTAKDVEALKRELSKQARLKKSVVSGAKELIARGKTPDLNWSKLIEINPSIVREIERQNVEIPAIEKHIPDEAVKAKAYKNESIPQDETQERPFFGDNLIARYEWHLKNGFKTPEDMEFKQWFESSNIYRMLYQNAAVGG